MAVSLFRVSDVSVERGMQRSGTILWLPLNGLNEGMVGCSGRAPATRLSCSQILKGRLVWVRVRAGAPNT